MRDGVIELRTRMVTVSPLIHAFFQEPGPAAWLRRFAGECGVSEMLLLDPHAWIPEVFYYGILSRIQDTVPDPVKAVREAAHQNFSYKAIGTFYTLARAFGTPRLAYYYYSDYLNRIQAIGRYELMRLGQLSATIRYTSKRKTRCEAVDCAYRLGALEALPTVFGYPLARVESVACASHGDADCVYEISWVSPRKILWWPTLIGVVLLGFTCAKVLSWLGVQLSPACCAIALSLIGLGGWFWWAQKGWRRRLEHAEKLVVEQQRSIQQELVNLWEKHEETVRRVREEERLRRIFQLYVPRPVVENALKQEGHVRSRGSNVQATILFADLVGFTTYAESSSPTDLLETINLYLGRFSEVISVSGGVIDKFMGDAIMALFGVIEPDPQHARQAVQSALAMLDALDEINCRTGHKFQLRIGINTGPVVAGHVGSRERVAYTVMGDTVNVARRLESQADSGMILVNESVKDACGDAFAFEFVSESVVRGRKVATRMYSVVRS